LEHQVIFNKGAVMVLPPSVNKGSGLAAALRELRLSPHNVVAIGDAENDHALLRLAEFGVAVANAVPMLKREADLTSEFEAGDAVINLVDHLIADDLARASDRAVRRRLALGTREDGAPLRVPAAGASVLVAGPPGSGKSAVAGALLERLCADGYQTCVIDAHGRVPRPRDAVVLGGERAPAVEEVLGALARPDANVVVDLAATASERFVAELAPRLDALRARTGRPHWLVLDDARRAIPHGWPPPDRGYGVLAVTVHPEAASALEPDVALALGAAPGETLERLAAAAGTTLPEGGPVDLGSDEALAWRPRRRDAPFRLRLLQGGSGRRPP
jgi:hypothetical protein